MNKLDILSELYETIKDKIREIPGAKQDSQEVSDLLDLLVQMRNISADAIADEENVTTNKDSELRYFIACYKTKNNEGLTWFSAEGFPSYSDIVEHSNLSDSEKRNLIITNIFEFKNQEDFDSFKQSTPNHKKKS